MCIVWFFALFCLDRSNYSKPRYSPVNSLHMTEVLKRCMVEYFFCFASSHTNVRGNSYVRLLCDSAGGNWVENSKNVRENILWGNFRENASFCVVDVCVQKFRQPAEKRGAFFSLPWWFWSFWREMILFEELWPYIKVSWTIFWYYVVLKCF